jgi:hypothetical protein
MALDRSLGLHAICVRVGAGHKECGHKNGVSFRIHGIGGAMKKWQRLGIQGQTGGHASSARARR